MQQVVLLLHYSIAELYIIIIIQGDCDWIRRVQLDVVSVFTSLGFRVAKTCGCVTAWTRPGALHLPLWGRVDVTATIPTSRPSVVIQQPPQHDIRRLWRSCLGVNAVLWQMPDKRTTRLDAVRQNSCVQLINYTNLPIGASKIFINSNCEK